MFFSVSTLLAVTIIGSQQVNGEENEWLVKATNAQYSIKDSIAKVNGYGTSEDVIKLITDNAFDDFVNFVRKGFTTILNKASETSGSDPYITININNWVEWLERMNIRSENFASTAQDSLNKFESTIQIIVKKAPSFGERVRTASPEDRGIMTDIGILMSKIIDKLSDDMKAVESQLLKYMLK